MKLFAKIELDYSEGRKRYHVIVTDESGTFEEETFASSFVTASSEASKRFDKIIKFIDLVTAEYKPVE